MARGALQVIEVKFLLREPQVGSRRVVTLEADALALITRHASKRNAVVRIVAGKAKLPGNLCVKALVILCCFLPAAFSALGLNSSAMRKLLFW